ncbi:MAG: DedA family protein [Acidobacteriota bacterium]|jgi:membrane protein DedA with SNARE-associated domain|nr:DedA family protein [Acidobacteriota bacterium]
MSPVRLAELLEDWGYATYLFLLSATGVGSPIPEDLILATAGYLITAGVFSWAGAYAVGVIGVVGSDALLYTWGLRFRSGAHQGWMSRFVRPHHLAAADRWLTRFGDRAVFFARLLPGTRAVVFLGAGLRGMPFGRFLLYDGAGALVWVPIVLMAGAQLGEEIGGLDQLGATIGRFAAWIAGALIVLILLWRWWRVEESKL